MENTKTVWNGGEKHTLTEAQVSTLLGLQASEQTYRAERHRELIALGLAEIVDDETVDITARGVGVLA